MKPRNASQPGKGAGRRISPMRIPQIPMEWMDPMSWRLPSGKALAEFALQAGFLAPLMLGTPSFRRRKKKKASGADAGVIEAMDAEAMHTETMHTESMNMGAIEKQREERREAAVTFRDKTDREAGR